MEHINNPLSSYSFVVGIPSRNVRYFLAFYTKKEYGNRSKNNDCSVGCTSLILYCTGVLYTLVDGYPPICIWWHQPLSNNNPH